MAGFLSEGLTRRFLLLVASLLLVSAFVSQRFFIGQERANLESRLQEKANFINKYSSDRIAVALIQKDDVSLLQVINQLEDDHEIFSVVVVDQRGLLRYNRDPDKVGTPTSDPALINVMKTGQAGISVYQNSGGRALALLTPMVVRGLPGPLGAIRIDLTYRMIEQQIAASSRRYWFVILGSLTTAVTLMSLFVGRWVINPLEHMKKGVTGLNPDLPESNLYESPDEFGKLAAAINQFIRKARTELQRHTVTQSDKGEQEKAWICQLAMTLLPGARIIIADKDNRVVSDSEGAAAKATGGKTHLLDLITDTPFANLLTAAFQQEGEPTRGAVSFQNKSYMAMILSVPGQQSITVKTIIALQPN